MLHAILRRLKYTALTAAALAAGAAGLLVFTYAFMLLTMVAFAASTGAAYERFISHFLPIAHFAAGAFLAAGAVALLNAMVAPRPFWLRSMLGAAALGGVFLLVRPSVGDRVTRLAVPVMTAIHDLGKEGQEKEKASAVAFVKSQKAVADAVGQDFRASVASIKLVKDAPVEYDISVVGRKTAYAIVRVSRSSGRVDFALACMTPLHGGQRDPFKGACEQ
jgi:hypothetical protein